MPKRLIALISAVLLCEAGVFLWTANLAGTNTLSYQLAARYSARVSFFIFSGILLWTGLAGLKSIYAKEASRKMFVDLTLLFSINHIIHLFFLMMNFRINDLSLVSARNAGGAVVYLILMAIPVYLWKRQAMSRQLYLVVYIFFLAITSLFFLTYLGRLTKELPMPSSQGYFITSLVWICGLVLLHGYRVWAEHNPMRPAMS